VFGYPPYHPALVGGEGGIWEINGGIKIIVSEKFALMYTDIVVDEYVL
jgi:hypothetical protein